MISPIARLTNQSRGRLAQRFSDALGRIGIFLLMCVMMRAIVRAWQIEARFAAFVALLGGPGVTVHAQCGRLASGLIAGGRIFVPITYPCLCVELCIFTGVMTWQERRTILRNLLIIIGAVLWCQCINVCRVVVYATALQHNISTLWSHDVPFWLMNATVVTSTIVIALSGRDRSGYLERSGNGGLRT